LLSTGKASIGKPGLSIGCSLRSHDAVDTNILEAARVTIVAIGGGTANYLKAVMRVYRGVSSIDAAIAAPTMAGANTAGTAFSLPPLSPRKATSSKMATSWNITNILRRRRASNQQQKGRFIALNPKACSTHWTWIRESGTVKSK
jgi:hypothetical protein